MPPEARARNTANRCVREPIKGQHRCLRSGYQHGSTDAVPHDSGDCGVFDSVRHNRNDVCGGRGSEGGRDERPDIHVRHYKPSASKSDLEQEMRTSRMKDCS
jgi:hypothetical protein